MGDKAMRGRIALPKVLRAKSKGACQICASFGNAHSLPAVCGRPRVALNAGASTAVLLTRTGHRNHEFAVLLGYEVFGAARGAAVCVLFLNLDDKLFRRF
jgi:hypothetical protein